MNAAEGGISGASSLLLLSSSLSGNGGAALRRDVMPATF
jgi:hypothetical protein